MIFDLGYDNQTKKTLLLKQSLNNLVNTFKDDGFKGIWTGKLNSQSVIPSLLTNDKASTRIAEINKYSKKVKSGKSTWQEYFDTLNDGNRYIHSYIQSTNDSKYSTESLMEANKAAIKTQTEHNKSLEVGGLKAKAGSVAMKGLSFGLNAVSNVAASLLIGSAITAIDNLIHRNENLIKSGKEAQQNISDTFQAYSQKSNVVSQVSDKYEELSKGVNSLTNQNISLSDSGYKEFLDISNQLAGVFPSIVSGYDSQGNAILNLGNNAQSAAEQLQSLLDVQKKSANVEIGDNLQTSYDGVIAQVHSYETDIEKYKKLKSEAEDNLSSIQSPYKSNGILNGLSKGLVTLNPATMDNVSRYVSEFNKALTQNNISPFSEILDDGKINIRFDADMPKDQMNNIQKDLSAFIEQQSEVYTADIADYNQKIEVAEMKTKDEWASLNAPISKYLQTSDSFSGLSENLQGALISNLNNIDISSLNGKYEGDMKTFLFSDFIKPMSDLTPDVQKQMGKLLELDPSKMTLDDYTKEWSNSLQEIFPDDSEAQSGWEKKLGFNNAFNNAIKDTQLLQKTFSSNGQDINNMSIGDREIAYDLIVNDKFTGSFDQLTERVASTKAELEKLEEPDLFNEWQQAEQSANSGDKYVQMANGLNKAKQLFDQGLVGTDDFKSYAAMISPTGMDDPANFEENYGKIKRYFNTDSNQGVLNFLDDLSTKTDESGKALASFDEESGKWAFNIKDMEDASKQMGIGIEPLMSMFGRLEDYGISNNFVSSIEDGTEHVEKLYSQLAKEEEILKELQKPGQYETTDSNGNTSFTAGNQTAIDSTQEKINGLKGDIQETLGFMDELVNRSAEDYSTEVSSAKDTINKLAEQRKQVLDDGWTTELLQQFYYRFKDILVLVIKTYSSETQGSNLSKSMML